MPSSAASVTDTAIITLRLKRQSSPRRNERQAISAFHGSSATSAQAAARCTSYSQPCSVNASPHSPVRVSAASSPSSTVFV